MVEYVNGNTKVTILSDGTKIREYESTPLILFPESIDVKISNFCDLGCEYCHEMSTTAGKHGDLDVLLETISELPAGVELAIGGGNPLSHPDLLRFLYKVKEQGIIANITVNQGHLKRYFALLELLIKEDLVKGIGVSITSNNLTYLQKLKTLSNNIVYHVIAGVNDFSVLETLISLGDCKVLVLGYKVFGFGVGYYNQDVSAKIQSWKKIKNYFGKCVISFDNLAIEQLEIKKMFTVEGWQRFYMGDDFTFTMYIDAVEQKYAPTSRSLDRVSFKDSSLINYFQSNKF